MKLHPILLGATGLAAVVASLHAAGVPGDPPVFSNPTSITNPYHPFVPGRVKRFESGQGHTDAEVFHNYLPGTRDFAWNGTVVTCRTLQEYELEDGELAEISWNYFAQADDGTVCYFGAVVDIYENGSVVSHDGSWLVGGPMGSDPPETATAPDPTVFMPDDPQVGDIFKPEDLFPIVDETAEVVRVGRRVHVPAGTFNDCIQTHESTLLSDDTENKWWAPGIGVIKEKEHGGSLLLEEVIDP